MRWQVQLREVPMPAIRGLGTTDGSLVMMISGLGTVVGMESELLNNGYARGGRYETAPMDSGRSFPGEVPLSPPPLVRADDAMPSDRTKTPPWVYGVLAVSVLVTAGSVIYIITSR